MPVVALPLRVLLCLVLQDRLEVVVEAVLGLGLGLVLLVLVKVVLVLLAKLEKMVGLELSVVALAVSLLSLYVAFLVCLVCLVV